MILREAIGSLGSLAGCHGRGCSPQHVANRVCHDGPFQGCRHHGPRRIQGPASRSPRTSWEGSTSAAPSWPSTSNARAPSPSRRCGVSGPSPTRSRSRARLAKGRLRITALVANGPRRAVSYSFCRSIHKKHANPLQQHAALLIITAYTQRGSRRCRGGILSSRW